MKTVRSLIERSLRLIEELGEGQSATAAQISDGLEAMIAMLDVWSIEGAAIFTETNETFSLVAGTKNYTMGSGGTFNTSRPVRLRYATQRDAGGTFDEPLLILSLEEYAVLPDKDTQGKPEYVYFDGNYPLANLKFYPNPSEAYQVTLYSEKPLSTYSSANDVVSLPPGYEQAIPFNLAVVYAPEFGKEAKPSVIQTAITSYNAIRNKNRQNDKNTVRVDDALLESGGMNVLTRE